MTDTAAGLAFLRLAKGAKEGRDYTVVPAGLFVDTWRDEMPIQRKFFFDHVRDALFGGSLTQTQVDGLNLFLDYADKHNEDDRHLGYVLATAFHETARTMQPIAEYGQGKGKEYGKKDPETGQVYYGRGYVQLTWKENYAKMDSKLHLDGELVAKADLALDPDIAMDVIWLGMKDGDFTGQCLNDHIECGDPKNDETDLFNARKIVNALDCAGDIEAYARKFIGAITRTPNSRESTERG